MSVSNNRTWVVENIAGTRAGTEASGFGNFIQNEGRIQEMLGIWPPNSGAYAPVQNITLSTGTQIDRYGFPGGSFVSPAGASFAERALPSAYETTKPYFQYEVLKPIDGVTEAKVLPWFE